MKQWRSEARLQLRTRMKKTIHLSLMASAPCISWLLVRAHSLNDDFAVHSSRVMAGNETGEFEFAHIREFPQKFALLENTNALCAGIGVLLIRKFLADSTSQRIEI